MSTNSTKKFSWKIAILLCLGVGLLTAGLSVFIQVQSKTLKNFPIIVEKLNFVNTNQTQSGSGSSFEAPSNPSQLIIPAIGVKAKIQSVGLTKEGAIGVPDNFIDVAWYNQGPVPGMPGTAIITGHFDGDGKKIYKAVFYDLDKLTAGNLITIVDQKGKIFEFQVVGAKIYDYNASTDDIFSNDNTKARLVFITCAGKWIKSKKIYDKRIVVFTELVKSD